MLSTLMAAAAAVMASESSILGTPPRQLQEEPIVLASDNINSAVRLWLDTDNNNRTLVEDVYGGPIETWDTSRVTDFSRVFADIPRGTGLSSRSSSSSSSSISLEQWDVSRVTSMQGLFANTNGFSAQGLNAWDVSAVQDMSDIWKSATDFASDVSTWNTASLQTLRGALLGYSHSKPLNSTEETTPIISTWKTPSLTDMGGLFANTEFFHTNLEGWTTSKVTNMANMLEDTRNFYGGDLSLLDTSSVTSMERMFAGAVNVRGAREIGATWQTVQVRSMERIFYNTSLTYGDPANPVPGDSYLFYLCWDVTGLVMLPLEEGTNTENTGTKNTTNGLDEAFCFSNAGGFNCECVPDDIADRINKGCNTTRKTCFNSLSSAGDSDDNSDNAANNEGVPDLVDATGSAACRMSWGYYFLLISIGCLTVQCR